MKSQNYFKPVTRAIKLLPKTHRNKYAITELKKAELDALTLEVVYAQIEVNQYQAIVNSLTTKTANYLNYMNIADNRRTQAMNNKNAVDQLVQNAKDLKKNSKIVFNDMSSADSKTKDLTEKINELINKLIYSAELINRLAIMVTRQKALNPLISDDLISRITTAGSDANNAVAVTLLALNSTFACGASNLESEAATALEYEQTILLLQQITGNDSNDKKTTASSDSILGLLHAAYDKAKKDFDNAQTAWNITNQQLNDSITKLNDAQIKLQSLQSGLAAGNAAALAS